MQFIPTKLRDAFLIEPSPHADQRGVFVRMFCQEEFAKAGLETNFVQANRSMSELKGTLRGMHMQASPHSEVKLVQCMRGAVFDVVIDLRPNSETYMGWVGYELTESNRRQLYVPKGFAHGFQTLSDGAEVGYLVSNCYNKDAERGVRFDDPIFGIQWPLNVTIVSDKDSSWPPYSEERLS